MNKDIKSYIRVPRDKLLKNVSSVFGFRISFEYEDQNDSYKMKGIVINKKYVYEAIAKIVGVKSVTSVEPTADNKHVYITVEPLESLNSRISINLDDNFSLVAEKNCDNDYKEIVVGIESSEGVWYQDLALIGQNYKYGQKTGNVERIPGEYIARVYTDENIDDYTESFKIKLYKQED